MEVKEAAENQPSNPYFEVLASGNFSKEQVNAKLVPPPHKPVELVTETERVWEEKNKQRIENGKPPMTDNSQLAIKTVTVIDGQLEIDTYPAKYSDLIAMQDASVKARFGEYAPQILGTNVLTKTADGKLIIAQRGFNVATKPGAMSAPGGYPNLSTDLSAEDAWAPFSTVGRELKEETRINEN